ncbi:hypothetical protein JYT16_02530, partial [Gemmatimonas aurantiaca]|nr:hypothetical protein [Gemmatimonas aurantiaca]
MVLKRGARISNRKSPSYSFISGLLIFGLVVFSFVSCGENTTTALESCATPKASDTDTLHGEYVWSDATGARISQLSIFLLRTNGKFFMRVDTTIENPVRRFSDMSADYLLTDDSLILSNVSINTATGGNFNVPDGGFIIRCESDSVVYTAGEIPGNTPDTLMRI